jgi:hypothetical protein
VLVKETSAQGYTAPKFTFGAAGNGDFAVNDFYGTQLTNPNNYGAMWGRGIQVYGKLGLGKRKNHRLAVNFEYDKMVNDNMGGKAMFFVTSPNPPHTFYDIFSGTFGYEYVFGARCLTRQYLGLALSANSISAPDYNANGEYNSTLRFGFAFNVGYEWVLDKQQKYGFNLGLRYHILNAFNPDNSTTDLKNLNDGSGPGGAGFYRRIGMITLNLGFNVYQGQQPLVKRK